MRMLLLAAALTAVPAAAYAGPTTCATTINSKGVETTVCNPGEPSTAEPACHAYHAGSQHPLVPYVKVCVAP